MSWTNECTESNEFKVKNTREVIEVLELMGFDVYNEEGISFRTSGKGTFFDDSAEVVLSLKPVSIEGIEKNLIGIISDYTNDSIDLNDLESEYGVKEDEVMVVPITEYLQDQLLDNKQYVTITCAGFESRSWGSYAPFGDATIITKNDTKFFNLAQVVDNYLKR
jgi:hypothetical protein